MKNQTRLSLFHLAIGTILLSLCLSTPAYPDGAPPEGAGVETAVHPDGYLVYLPHPKPVYPDKSSSASFTSPSLLADGPFAFNYSLYPANNNGITLRKTRTITPNGDTILFNYDAMNNLISSGPPEALWQFAYDSLNRRTQATTPLGSTTTYSYDDSSPYGSSGTLFDRTKTTDTLGNTNEFYYDELNRILVTIDAAGNITRFEYDANGNRTKMIDKSGQETKYEYNALNLPIKKINPEGYVKTLKYTPRGLLKKKTDFDGTVFKYRYNKNGKLSSIIWPSNRKIKYTYDSAGNLSAIVTPSGQKTRYTNNLQNLVEKITRNNKTKIKKEYDLQGNLVRKINSEGQTIIYLYDENNRLIEKRLPDTTVRYEYSPHDQITLVQSPSGTIRYEYTSTNLLSKVIYPGDKILSYNYDELGNRTKTVYPSGTTVNYAYDSLNRAIQITVTSPRLSEPKVFKFSYSKTDDMLQQTYPNGIIASNTFDTTHRLLTKTIGTAFDPSSIDKIDCTYDSGFNKLSRRTRSGTWNYSYDADKQLTSVFGPNGYSLALSYDLDGNRTLATEMKSNVTTKTSSSYDNVNRIQTSKIISKTGKKKTKYSIKYKHDKNGNLTLKDKAKNKLFFGWNAKEAMTSARLEDGTPVQYNWYFNQRFTLSSKETPAQKTTYLYDVDNIIAKYDKDGTLIQEFIYGLGPDSILCRIDNPGNILYFHQDDLSSVIALTDDSQTIVASYIYDAFGNILSETGTAENEILFASRWYDKDLKLYYFRARWYDPQTGRFTNEDPLGINDLETNLYIYVLNNPINHRDISGLRDYGADVDWQRSQPWIPHAAADAYQDATCGSAFIPANASGPGYFASYEGDLVRVSPGTPTPDSVLRDNPTGGGVSAHTADFDVGVSPSGDIAKINPLKDPQIDANGDWVKDSVGTMEQSDYAALYKAMEANPEMRDEMINKYGDDWYDDLKEKAEVEEEDDEDEKDPVSLLGGKYSNTYVDLLLNGPGATSGISNLYVSRSYSSQDSSCGMFGQGWSSNLDSLMTTNDSVISLKNSRGNLLTFSIQPDTQILIGPACTDTKLYMEDSAFVWQQKYGTLFKYEPSIDLPDTLVLSNKTDRFDNQIDFTYELFINPVNNTGIVHPVQMIEIATGRTITIEWQWLKTPITAYHVIKKISDPAGRFVTYDYSLSANSLDKGLPFLTKVTDQNGKTEHYEVLTREEAGNTIYDSLKIINKAGNSTTFYFNNPFEFTTTPGDLINNRRIIKLKDHRNREMTLVNDMTLSTTILEDKNGHASAFEYSKINLNKILYPNGKTELFSYDPSANVSEYTDPNGQITTYEHTPSTRNTLLLTDPLGHTEEWTYDESSNLWTSYKDKNGNIWTRTISDDNVIDITNPLGYKISYEYNTFGNKVKQSDSKGQTFFYTYDGNGNMTSLTDPKGNTWKYTYDIVGNLLSEEDPRGYKTQYVYDNYGRPLSKIQPNGGVIYSKYNAQGNNISREDTLGNLIQFDYE